MTRDEALKIAAVFDKSITTVNKEIINNFTKEEIKQALATISTKDNQKQWYKEMERRIEELNKLEDKKEQQKEKVKDRWVNIFFDVIVKKILTWLLAFMLGGAVVYSKIKFNNIKIFSDNNKYKITSPVIIDNRKYVDLKIQKIINVSNNHFKLEATAKDAVTGDTVEFIGETKINHLLLENGGKLLTEDGKSIILEK